MDMHLNNKPDNESLHGESVSGLDTNNELNLKKFVKRILKRQQILVTTWQE